MASVRAEFVSRGPGVSKHNPSITVHGRMYHEMGALQAGAEMLPQYVPVCIHDSEHGTFDRKYFYSCLREDLLSRLTLLLEQNNKLVKSCPSLLNLVQNIESLAI